MRSLEDLHHGFGPRHLQHLSGAVGAVRQLEVDDLGELGELDVVQDDQGAVDARHRLVGDAGLGTGSEKGSFRSLFCGNRSKNLTHL